MLTLEIDGIKLNFNVSEFGCWEFTGSRTCGYGTTKGYRVHRLMYALFVGEIPPHMFVCHHCDNPSCANPDHLFIGAHQDNMDDRKSKDRGRKLTSKDRDTIIMLRSLGLEPSLIAKIYGITPGYVSELYIKSRRRITWIESQNV